MAILYGNAPSYFTRKTWIAMRLLGLQVDNRLKSLAVKAKVEAAVNGYHRFPVVQTDQGDWLTDSTVIVRELSHRNPTHSLLPPDPAADILLWILDEWLDEWFLRAAYAWRVTDPETRHWVAIRGAKNMLGLPVEAQLPDDLIDAAQQITHASEGFFLSAGAINGIHPENADQIRHFADSCLGVLNQVLGQSRYLSCARAGMADAALWGFLEAGFLWEPKPRTHVMAQYPALVAFHQRMIEDAQKGGAGTDGWDDLQLLARRLAPILSGDALGFVPFLIANRNAINAGEKHLEIAGAGAAARGFTDKNRQKIAQHVAALSIYDQQRLSQVIGAWPLWDLYNRP